MEKTVRVCIGCFCVLTLVVVGGIMTWKGMDSNRRKIEESSNQDKRHKRDDGTQTFLGGAAAGGYHGHTGAPVNLLCLPRVPTWGRYNDVLEGVNVRSYLFGVEYRPQANDFPFSHENAETLVQHNVPCAVCRSTVRSTQLMVPGRNNCLDGWHLEYSGYMMSGSLDQAGSSEFVCVDKDPEADPAGYRPESSHHLFTVEATCGSIPCPNYINGREVTCSVCTK